MQLVGPIGLGLRALHLRRIETDRGSGSQWGIRMLVSQSVARDARWICIRASVLSLCLWVLACATQLAPAYDKTIIDGLNTANTEAMTLFASTSGGTTKATFPAREDKYNALVGKLDALAIAAGARPLPKTRVTETINNLLIARGGQGLAEDLSTPPSAHAIQRVSDTVAKMRDTDKTQGVTALEVQAFRGQAVIYLDQAITYENFLQR
jgi:hypothetical protein